MVRALRLTDDRSGKEVRETPSSQREVRLRGAARVTPVTAVARVILRLVTWLLKIVITKRAFWSFESQTLHVSERGAPN